jgi:uncharacterized membrane protein
VVVRLRAVGETIRNSLFFVPVLCVLFGLALAIGMLALDQRVELGSVSPLLRFTVESARQLLATMAGAIITVAAIVFALTGLSVQLASSQFSPRVVRGFLRSRTAQFSIGFTVGTFTYTVVVLRAVRSADGAPDVVPALSTALALVLAVAAVVAIVAFVSRTAHRLQSSELIRSVAEETLDAVRRELPARGQGGRGSAARRVHPPALGWAVRANSMGWVAQISAEQVLDVLPAGGMARVEVKVGQFVHPGRRLCTVWGELDKNDKAQRRVNRAFAVGSSRTMQQDVGFGIRQMVDIALRALSPGVNDPTTAHECIVHLGAVLYEILRRDLPPTAVFGQDGRCVVLADRLTYSDYVSQAFDEIRQCAVALPTLASALVETLAGIASELKADGISQDERGEALARQARLLVAGVERSCPLPDDAKPVLDAAKMLGVGLGQR